MTGEKEPGGGQECGVDGCGSGGSDVEGMKANNKGCGVWVASSIPISSTFCFLSRCFSPSYQHDHSLSLS